MKRSKVLAEFEPEELNELYEAITNALKKHKRSTKMTMDEIEKILTRNLENGFHPEFIILSDADYEHLKIDMFHGIPVIPNVRRHRFPDEYSGKKLLEIK